MLNAVFLDARSKKVRLINLAKNNLLNNLRQFLKCQRVEHLELRLQGVTFSCFTDDEGAFEITDQDTGTLDGIKIVDISYGEPMYIPKGLVILMDDDSSLTTESETIILNEVRNKSITFTKLSV